MAPYTIYLQNIGYMYLKNKIWTVISIWSCYKHFIIVSNTLPYIYIYVIFQGKMQNVSWYLKSSIVSTWDDSFHYIQFLCFSCITYTLRCDITVVFQYVYTYVYTLKFASRNVKNVLIKQNTFSTFLKFSVIKWNSGNGGGGGGGGGWKFEIAFYIT